MRPTLGIFFGLLIFALPVCADESRRKASETQPVLPPVVKPVLLFPTQGRPVFVEPGGNLRIAAQIPGGTSGNETDTVEFALVSGRFPGHRHVLPEPPDAREKLADGAPQILSIPENLPEQTYDLEIRRGATRLAGRHCVAVLRDPGRPRIVHLSNMNIGEIGAPAFDARLVEEVNLVAPTLIVATGDYLDATHTDPQRGWRELADFFAQFDAPALLACGDHDDMDLYSQHFAPSLIGSVDVGRYRGVVLFDHPARPIEDDPAQIRWVERALTATTSGADRIAFVVSHDECPNLLRYWQQRNTLQPLLRAARLGAWFAGGHRDWDGREYRALIDAAAPLLFLRTQQSSPAMLDGAEGVSHYRMVDFADGRAILPHDTHEKTNGGIPPSIGVGRLSATIHGHNDGTRMQLAFTATNRLPYRLDRLGLRLLLRRTDEQPPWCLGAQLTRLTKLDGVWECFVTFDLPDKGTLQALVGTGPRPALPNVDVRFDLPKPLRLKTRRTEDGFSFLTLASGTASIILSNDSPSIAEITPLVRLDGGPLAYRPCDKDKPFAAAYRLRLAPGESATLQLDLSAVRVLPGRRELQVYWKDGPAWGPACGPLEITVEP